MEKREALFQKIDRAVILIYLGTNLFLAVRFLLRFRLYEFLLAVGAPVFLFLPFGLYRLLKMKPVYQLNFIVYIFVFFAYSMGLIVHCYDRIPCYDKVIHTLSGVFCTLLALGLFYCLKPEKKIERRDFPLACVFSAAVSIAISGLWEISEYGISLLFGTDPQHVLTTGISDTMGDMIVCTIGSLLLLISFAFYYKKGKKDFLLGAFDVFFLHLSQRGKG